jgi:hypothetical protein
MEPLARAELALEGLSIDYAFGQMWDMKASPQSGDNLENL